MKNFLLLPCLLMLGCASSPSTKQATKQGVAPATGARPKAKGLSQVEAARRKAMIGKVDYLLDFDLVSKTEFKGAATIDFELKSASAPLTIDFSGGGKIDGLTINGVAQPQFDYNGLFLAIRAEKLVAGRNVINVRFTSPYNKSGVGLYRFEDREDNRSYLYTKFEPYDANQLFPCFDQPDLKATYAFTARVPLDWVVVGPTSGASRRDGGQNVWTFPRSQSFSTYLFSIHAGPYKVWTSQSRKIPLRLLARRSMARYVQAEEWLKLTRQGLEFFPKYFAQPYPFVKYDQIIVPDFNSGAMENVGAVTFSERYVKRSVPTYNERESLANVLLHEMAHMWFGNLVTMGWWNGLWLNESFATYMAAVAQMETTEFKTAWASFYNSSKNWGYFEDQLVTTHPIEAVVPDTETAFSNFDGITYGKGASVLKQLAHFVGEKQFRDGVRIYLREHAFANAELSDFMGAIERASATKLERWTDEWLGRAGLNALAPRVTCHEGRLESLVLEQSAPSEWPTLRQHRTSVALFNVKNGRVSEPRLVSVSYDGASTPVEGVKGLPCPDLVYPNFGDHDFAKMILDSRSVETVRTHLRQLRDPLLRQMVWMSLWDMVRDAKWPVTDYADLVMSALGEEKVLPVFNAVIRTVVPRSASSGDLYNYLPQLGEPGEAIGTEYRERMERFLWDSLAKAPAGSDLQRLWFDALTHFSSTPEAMTKLHALFTGKKKVPGLVIDQDRRWSVLVRLAMVAHPDTSALLESEKQRDGSDLGAKFALAVAAVQPDAAVKTKWLNEVTARDSTMALGQARYVIGALFPRNQLELKRQFAGQVLDALADLVSRKDNAFLATYMGLLAPLLCSEQSTSRLEAAAKGAKSYPPTVFKALRVAHQEDGRCLKIRALLLSQDPALQRRAG